MALHAGESDHSSVLLSLNTFPNKNPRNADSSNKFQTQKMTLNVFCNDFQTNLERIGKTFSIQWKCRETTKVVPRDVNIYKKLQHWISSGLIEPIKTTRCTGVKHRFFNKYRFFNLIRKNDKKCFLQSVFHYLLYILPIFRAICEYCASKNLPLLSRIIYRTISSHFRTNWSAAQ